MEVVLNSEQIKELLPHRYPFLFIDRVIELEPGKWIKGIKNVTLGEPFFQGHFPGNPIMPGVLQLEALAQVAGICGFSTNTDENKLNNCVLTKIEEAKFKRVVVPGDQLIISCKLVKRKGPFWWFAGKTEVEGVSCLEVQLSSKMF